jgi:oxygen-independent coproporphyrinogen-3 oxidase
MTTQTNTAVFERDSIEMLPPLSLYVHIPWCLKKCPYCDFNSHVSSGNLPEAAYLSALVADLKHDQTWSQERPIKSIFFGGGTPSLMSADFFSRFLDQVARVLNLDPNIEITMEANPGTLECAPYSALLASGINRLSLGIQSLNGEYLRSLGRIHSADTALKALNEAMNAGFNSINADLMFGLPQQSTEDALGELQSLIATGVPHVSWYQLTLEPNTQFYKHPPPLPPDDAVADIAESGQALLSAAGLTQYEVSAFAKPAHACHHNQNYWRFGDYLGIGAGAHGKITQTDGTVLRTTRTRLPQHYLDQPIPGKATIKLIHKADLVFEYCLNRFRLFDPIDLSDMQQHTGWPTTTLIQKFNLCTDNGWVTQTKNTITLTPLGKRFLNDVITAFLPDE